MCARGEVSDGFVSDGCDGLEADRGGGVSVVSALTGG